MPGPAKKKKSKANRPKPARVSISGAQSSEYVPPNEFLESVYHAEGWSNVVDVLCAMLDLPGMSFNLHRDLQRLGTVEGSISSK